MTETPLQSGFCVNLPTGLSIHADCSREFLEVLTRPALEFVVALERRFRGARSQLLDAREGVQQHLDAGGRLDFLPGTVSLREDNWRVGAIPKDLRDRTVEITGPVDRKMIINALNSGADVFMADFEDSNSPSFANAIQGQINLKDAVHRRISYVHPKTGKTYELGDKVATLMVRPRGWHLVDKHVHVDGEPISAGILDFGLFLFHNANQLISIGSGPYFYLPKLESHLEARLWNSVFVHAQELLGLDLGTIKATVLIETITAAFQMDEILYALRDHSVGLNCGRWDYIFSFIKRFREHPDFVMPDRSSVGMDRHFLRSYSELLIKTCHRRGAHAMGGMAAQIPIKGDEAANEAAMAKVRVDKSREANAGHDGTWVAHPGLIAIAREEFNRVHPDPSRRLSMLREDVCVTSDDLLAVPEGEITEAGLRQNINVGLLYLEAWLRGSGCVPIHGLMEDAATAEISRTQIWQWIRHGAEISATGRRIDLRYCQVTLAEEIECLRNDIGDEAFAAGEFALACGLFDQLISSPDLQEFLTVVGYPHL